MDSFAPSALGDAWASLGTGARTALRRVRATEGLTQYLLDPQRWRHLDPTLFDTLKALVFRGKRSVAEIRASGILGNATFHDDTVDVGPHPVADRERRRDEWFEGVIDQLQGCDLVFADPDNGLCLDHRFTAARAENAKRIPLRELSRLAKGRAAIVYHHFHRSYSHRQQLREWLEALPDCRRVYHWRAWTPRAFFVLNTDQDIERRLRGFARKWNSHGSLVCREDLKRGAL